MQRVPFPVATATIVIGVALLAFFAIKLAGGSGTAEPTGRALSVGGERPSATRTAGATETARPAATSTPGLPPLPPRWPVTLQIGVADGAGGAPAMHATAPYGFRYQYLAGGVNTGHGWTTWQPDGAFVSAYIEESVRNAIVPVFTYYMMLQSAPGNADGEAKAVATNMRDGTTMRSYYADLRAFFRQAATHANELVVLHVEPDLWGFLEQQATRDNASTVPVQVAASGAPELAGLADNASGFAQAIVRLRDQYAPNVALAYHLSVWGTGNDIFRSNTNDIVSAQLGDRAAAFFNSLDAPFDIVFGEFSDRDAGFKEKQYQDKGAWWDDADFDRQLTFLRTFVAAAKKRIVLWQIPQGNTKMRAVDNSWNHYQDNRVEWLLDDVTRRHLEDYVRTGVVALLFGRGADGATCSCDANHDGVTNPPEINGNARESIDASDDGGYFRERSLAYYEGGALPLTDRQGSVPAKEQR